MTDIYDDLYTLLDADDWSNYGSQPPIFDSRIITTDDIGNGNYILVFPGDIENYLTGSGTIAYQRRRATITILATSKTNRENMLQDVKDALASSGYYLVGENNLLNVSGLNTRTIEVENIA